MSALVKALGSFNSTVFRFGPYQEKNRRKVIVEIIKFMILVLLF